MKNTNTMKNRFSVKNAVRETTKTITVIALGSVVSGAVATGTSQFLNNCIDLHLMKHPPKCTAKKHFWSKEETVTMREAKARNMTVTSTDSKWLDPSFNKKVDTGIFVTSVATGAVVGSRVSQVTEYIIDQRDREEDVKILTRECAY